MTFKRKGDKNKYAFVDAKCIGRQCWAPGMYQHRGATMSGSRNTGSPDSPCCMNRAYHGCPEGPDGERMDACPRCDGAGEVALTDGQTAICDWCNGAKQIRKTGLPVYQIEMAKVRKELGWRKA